MKRINNLIVTALLSTMLLAIVGCSDDFVKDNEIKSVTFSVEGIDERSETKMLMSDGGVDFIWQSTDTVGIYPNAGSQLFFAVGKGAGTTTVSFDGGGWSFKKGSTYQGYYPFVTDFFTQKSHIPVNFTGQVQDGNNSRQHLSRYIYMYTAASSSEGDMLNFSFKHLSAFIKAKVTLPAGTYIALKVSAEEPVFTTEGYFDLTAQVPAIVSTKSAKTVTLKMNNVTFTEPTELVALIAAAPVSVKGKDFTITVFDDRGNQYSYTNTNNWDLDAGYTNVYAAQSAFEDPEQPTGDGQLNDIDIEMFDWSEPGNDDWTKPQYPNEESDLSKDATANCYAALPEHSYSFNATVKGNSLQPLDGTPVKAEVLWESFGSSSVPNVGDVVKEVAFSEGRVSFTTVGEGNAVIAVKDSNDEILWSWHIWVTSADLGGNCQLYYGGNIMMDRNLGALSATPGDYKALGLLYQWGRKDPFLGSSNISSASKAQATVSEPSPVLSNSTTGTIEYATKNPTTFITYNSNNYDWYYTGDSNTDNTRWNSSKGIYDPCPPGWKVPDGGENGVWAKARFNSQPYDDENKGILFGKFFCNPSAWFPAAGDRWYGDGGLLNVGSNGYYWSCTPISYYAYNLYFYYDGYVYPQGYGSRALGRSVRCQSE